MEDKQNTSVKNASEEAFDVTGFILEMVCGQRGRTCCGGNVLLF